MHDDVAPSDHHHARNQRRTSASFLGCFGLLSRLHLGGGSTSQFGEETIEMDINKLKGLDREEGRRKNKKKEKEGKRKRLRDGGRDRCKHAGGTTTTHTRVYGDIATDRKGVAQGMLLHLYPTNSQKSSRIKKGESSIFRSTLLNIFTDIFSIQFLKKKVDGSRICNSWKPDCISISIRKGMTPPRHREHRRGGPCHFFVVTSPHRKRIKDRLLSSKWIKRWEAPLMSLPIRFEFDQQTRDAHNCRRQKEDSGEIE